MIEDIVFILVFLVAFLAILYCLSAILYLFRINGVNEKKMIDFYKNQRRQCKYDKE